jgi:spore maturation protein CgeB
VFWVRRLSREYRHVPAADVRYQKLSREQVAEVFRHSRVVVDLQREGQAGLTMRTFEALASGARLLTTNPDAAELGQELGPDVVYVVDPHDETGGIRTLARALSAPGSVGDVVASVERYGLAGWVRAILAAAGTVRRGGAR